ncbi:MAG: choice-of-anchor D domain-containing protein [Bryobacteraceae bacterium]
MTRKLTRTANVFGIVATILIAIPSLAQTKSKIPAADATVDATSRTVTTSSFSVTWNTNVDTEAVTALSWMGGPNLTSSFELNTCGNGDNDVEYSGNSWAPPAPNPQSGGLVLVGGGTIIPLGTVAWSGQVLASGTAQVTINSNSTNCPPSSAGINVQTTYRFFDPHNSAANWFGVQRVFDFTETAFPHDFRPYIARLNLSAGYTEVLYPSTGGTLAVMNVYNCPGGCTGPASAPGAAPLSPAWASAQGWFAIHNPSTLEGVVVKRVQSADPQGSPIAAQIWIDNDAGSNTNASSFLLMSPTAGFGGGLVTEVETLCFYNSAIWTPSLTPPPACINAPLNLFPGSLTFASQAVGATSTPKAAILKNVGTAAVTIAIGASGDFGESNDCPASLAVGAYCTIDVVFRPSAAGIRSGAVSIVDVAKNSPQTLSLAGLGLAAQ